MDSNAQWRREATVYVVDDDDSFRYGTLRLLDLAGLRGIAYSSVGNFLVDYLVGQLGARPACVLLDIAMPGPSCINLMKALARQESAPPIVLVTGRDDVFTNVDVMKSGAVDYLLKPVLAQRLLISIARALRVDMQQRPQTGTDEECSDARCQSVTPRSCAGPEHMAG